MHLQIDNTWKETLAKEFESPNFRKLLGFIVDQYKSTTVYPEFNNIFRAFNLCPLNEVKVIILGQDPYHGPNQANGLSFSVADGVKHPPSLRNIFKEIENDLGIAPPKSGNLERWAKQGVLLLNATLTVEADKAGSHQKQGWEQFTDAVIREVNEKCYPSVFILWGAYAQKKGVIIDSEKHLILQSAHPSPLAAHRGFFGNNHFSKANSWLLKQGRETIEW